VFFIMFIIIAVAALGILLIAVSATFGGGLTSCINWKDASMRSILKLS
ncbi:MAG: hypothetical protein ACI9RZ_001803, partial [Sphingobacteriales bacterium]